MLSGAAIKLRGNIKDGEWGWRQTANVKGLFPLAKEWEELAASEGYSVARGEGTEAKVSGERSAGSKGGPLESERAPECPSVGRFGVSLGAQNPCPGRPIPAWVWDLACRHRFAEQTTPVSSRTTGSRSGSWALLVATIAWTGRQSIKRRRGRCLQGGLARLVRRRRPAIYGAAALPSLPNSIFVGAACLTPQVSSWGDPR